MIDNHMDVLTKLRILAEEMGGRIIASSGKSVGFSLPDEDEDSGKTRTLLFKLSAHGNEVFLTQLSGPNKGKMDVVGSLDTIVSDQTG